MYHSTLKFKRTLKRGATLYLYTKQYTYVLKNILKFKPQKGLPCMP